MARITSQLLANLVQKRLFVTVKGKSSKPVDRQVVLVSLQQGIEAALKSENYSEVIDRLTELRDAQNNIFWIIDTSQKDISGHQILIRDARQVVEQPKEGFVGYAIIGMNYIRTAKKLLAIGNRLTLELNKVLASAATVFFASISKTDDPKGDLARLCVFLKSFIQRELDIKKLEAAEARLLVAKDFMGLEDNSRHIVTVSEIKGKLGKKCIVFDAEIALSELTKEQKQEYLQRKNKKWYTSLELWQQALVDVYVVEITSGKHVIPTQLRRYLVGIRNSYLKTIGFVSPEAVTILGENFHAGTPAHLGPDGEENKRITKLNIAQIDEQTGSTGVHIVTLNSPINPTGNDDDIVSFTGEATSDERYAHSNLPFNWLRVKSKVKLDGIEEQLQALKKIITDNNIPLDQELLQYIGGEAAPKSMAKNLNEYLENKFYGLSIPKQFEWPILIAILCRCHIDLQKKHHSLFTVMKNISTDPEKITRSLDPGNINLSIAIFSNLLNNALADLVFSVTGKAPSEKDYRKKILSACESGKDRDGVLMFFTTAVLLYAVLNDYRAPEELLSGEKIDFRSIIVPAAISTVGVVSGNRGNASAHLFFKKAMTQIKKTNEKAAHSENSKAKSDRSLANMIPEENWSHIRLFSTGLEELMMTEAVGDKEKSESSTDVVFAEVLCQLARVTPITLTSGITTPGCFGIKSDTRATFPEYTPREVRRLLILDTAKLNNKLPELDKVPASAAVFYHAANLDTELVTEMKILATYALQACRKRTAAKTSESAAYPTEANTKSQRISFNGFYKDSVAKGRTNLLAEGIQTIKQVNTMGELCGVFEFLSDQNKKITKSGHAGTGETQPKLDALASFFTSALALAAKLTHN